MNEEKEIQEISGIIREWANKPVFKNPFVMTDVSNSLLADDLAITLYNRGYRKADEVRKETAKDLLEALISTTEQTNVLKGDYKEFVIEELIKPIFALMGVEVDE